MQLLPDALGSGAASYLQLNVMQNALISSRGSLKQSLFGREDVPRTDVIF